MITVRPKFFFSWDFRCLCLAGGLDWLERLFTKSAKRETQGIQQQDCVLLRRVFTPGMLYVWSLLLVSFGWVQLDAGSGRLRRRGIPCSCYVRGLTFGVAHTDCNLSMPNLLLAVARHEQIYFITLVVFKPFAFNLTTGRISELSSYEVAKELPAWTPIYKVIR